MGLIWNLILDGQTGLHIRKGAYDAINRKVEKAGNKVPAETINRTKEIAANGGTGWRAPNPEKVLSASRIHMGVAGTAAGGVSLGPCCSTDGQGDPDYLRRWAKKGSGRGSLREHHE